MSLDAIYQSQIKSLPVIERLRLARLIMDELAESAPDGGVEAGLQALSQVKSQADIRRWRGQVQWEGDLDEMRRSRVPEKSSMVIVDTTIWIDYFNGLWD